MSRSWMLAAPAAMVLLVAGCATETTPMPMPTPVAIAPAPAPYIAPVAAAPMHEEAAPVRRTRRHRVVRRARPTSTSSGAVTSPAYSSSAPAYGRVGGGNAPTGGTEQTTSGPSAVGRVPAAAQPVGNGGS